MVTRLVAMARRMFGLQRVGRGFAVFPDDTFVISFPKSGNTWTRFLIANLVHPEEPASFANIDRLIPPSEGLPKREFERLRRPRIMKSHQYFDPRYRRVVYVVRDPRDVALSQYHFYRKRRRIEDDFPIEQFVTRFVAGTTSDYGSWAENVGSWLATRHGQPGFLLLRYEDMVAQTVQELGRVASFLEIPATRERLMQAVERSSAEQMRKLESAQPLENPLTKNTRQDIPFVRAASAGGWKSGLPEASVAELEAAWAPLMGWLGYEPCFEKQQAGVNSSFPQMVPRESRR